MHEVDFFNRADRYFRREDSLPARLIKQISTKQGQEYLTGDFKRACDIFAAASLCILGSPVIGVLAVKIKLEDGGSVFYKQARIGEDGKEIKIRKLRSMVKDNPAPNVDNSLFVKMFFPEDDPRVTETGAFLRAYDIDELPQVWNVLKGEMSMVGIRALPEYVMQFMQKHLTEDEYSRWESSYFAGKPGLFNLNAEISPNRKNDLLRRHADIFYEENASLGLDLYILFRTNTRIVKKIWMKLKGV